MFYFFSLPLTLLAKLLLWLLPKESKRNSSLFCALLTVSLLCLARIYLLKALICSLYFSLKAASLQIPCAYLVHGKTSCFPYLSRKMPAVYIVKRCFGLNLYLTGNTVYIVKTKDLLSLFTPTKNQ
jgi:hypothetical protein